MISYTSKAKSLLLHLMTCKYKVERVQRNFFNSMKNKFRENTSEIKLTLMSKAFAPANQHIMSFVYDTHPLSLKPVELND